MKKRPKFLAGLLALTMVASLALSGCGSSSSDRLSAYDVEHAGGTSPYRVCMITDSGDITDQSFNQTTYEACYRYCTANKIDFTYLKPDSPTDYARECMVDVGVAQGYNVFVMPGYVFAATVDKESFKYPDAKFIVLDMSAGDLISAAVGSAYYDNPDAYNAGDYYNTANTYCAVYQEAVAGYLAGYAAVKLGYTKLGFLGGQAVPNVVRFGYGYLQGIDQAAKELGITDQISVQYAYGGQFYGSTEITAVMDTWYTSGTEVVFACGGGIYTSAAEAAAKTGGKVIGVDVDQSETINAYGDGMTVTSAMKQLEATVDAMLDSIIYDNTWSEHVGKIENLGLVSPTDMSKNYVCLPEETTQWDDNFTVDDYHQLVADIYNGVLEVSSSTDSVPDVSISYNMREGTIM